MAVLRIKTENNVNLNSRLSELGPHRYLSSSVFKIHKNNHQKLSEISVLFSS